MCIPYAGGCGNLAIIPFREMATVYLALGLRSSAGSILSPTLISVYMDLAVLVPMVERVFAGEGLEVTHEV